ncbi:hypothetical protein YC2023_033567 [Brassica napus]
MDYQNSRGFAKYTTLHRRWFNEYFAVGYFSTREDMSSTKCQVGDGNLCFGGVLIIEDGWITKTHVVSRKTPENTLNRRWFNVFGLPKLTCISRVPRELGIISTREDMSSREEVRLEMKLSAMAGTYQNSRGLAKYTREHVNPTLVQLVFRVFLESWVFLNSRGHELYKR